MEDSLRALRGASAGIIACVIAGATAVFALQAPERNGRFDALAIPDPDALDVATTAVASLPVGHQVRSVWDVFRATHGQNWRVHLDRRSGAPLLAEGKGIPWTGAKEMDVAALAASLRPFIAANRALLLADDKELVFDEAGSGDLTDDIRQIVFRREVSGIPVSGERYVFTIGHGNLTSFGAPRWSRIDASPVPAIDAEDAGKRLFTYMQLTPADKVEIVSAPSLELIPLRATGSAALVWRVVVRVSGEDGTWLARIDAATGSIVSLVDDNRYARVKGGVYPISPDQNCPDGCEQPNYVMPFAYMVIGTNFQTASSMGAFNCTPSGSTATTALNGPYVGVFDSCGPPSESVTCDADLNLGASGGKDCTVPAGASPGNTHAARSSFYHLNRVAEHARSWLPGVAWLTYQLTDNVNIALTCNANWNGSSVNFYKSGGGCNNTGEIAGVLLHEWGHGLDQNDGGDYDNPSEAYADVTSILATHVSCMGRGFTQVGNCGGYGDACLSCSGVRDLDWDKHASHTPATPANFIASRCSGGGGPCGREAHCEGYVPAQAMWDLATRDLPNAGYDQNTAWFIVDKLWYKSRLGSGGNAYNCSLPDSDGCSATSWFQKLRAADDDDGDLSNGTPHANAIYGAFSRHKIACGTGLDASNQNSTSCPALAAPVLTAVPGSTSGTVSLTWTSVPGATSYKVSRNDMGCRAALTRFASRSNTNLVDGSLPNGLPMYYAVQATVANAACDGPLSNCEAVTPQPLAGVRPVADGTFGTAMTGSRGDASGSTIDVTWDVATCSSADHHILYGHLANVSTATVMGASCDLGFTGTATWTGVPAGNLWFVVVGNDGGTTEGSWGTLSTGAERGAGTASGRCGLTARDDSGGCP